MAVAYLTMTASTYLLAGQGPELQHLHLQARVWEPAARALVADLDLPFGARVLDVGCGALGWLRVLADRVPDGVVVGTDIDGSLLEAAAAACREAGHHHVRVIEDDLFHSALPAGMFDLVHARFQLCPLGRAEEQVACYRRLVKPGGVLILEEPDTRSWTYEPYAPATAHLIGRLAQAVGAAGGNLDMGRRLPALLREQGMEPQVRTHVLGLEAGHPYLGLPLQFAASLQQRLDRAMGTAAADALRAAAAAELADPARRGTTFTLVQAWARVPAA
jgi:SAM-dependent methyltransferase